MHPQQLLIDLVEQFCTYQQKQRGKTEEGVTTYRWTLEQFLVFVRKREGRPARIGDLSPDTVQAWMEHMAGFDLALSTMRSRQSTLSSFCSWLVKREMLHENPVAKLDRPRYERTPPTQVPGTELMDALTAAAKQRKRPRDIAIFLIMRYTGMRRASVASLRVRHLDADWGLRGVHVKGGKTRDIPVPSTVMKFLQTYVERVLAPEVGVLTSDTPLYWSRWPGKSGVRRVMPLHGKNIWRLCKTYGRMIGVPARGRDVVPSCRQTSRPGRQWRLTTAGVPCSEQARDSPAAARRSDESSRLIVREIHCLSRLSNAKPKPWSRWRRRAQKR